MLLPGVIWLFPKIGVFPQKMDGENNVFQTLFFLMDDLGGKKKTTFGSKTPLYPTKKTSKKPGAVHDIRMSHPHLEVC